MQVFTDTRLNHSTCCSRCSKTRCNESPRRLSFSFSLDALCVTALLACTKHRVSRFDWTDGQGSGRTCVVFFLWNAETNTTTHTGTVSWVELGDAGTPADDDHCNVRGTKRAARQYSLFEGHVELREWSSQGIDALTLESLVEYTLVHDVLDFSVEAGRLLRV